MQTAIDNGHIFVDIDVPYKFYVIKSNNQLKLKTDADLEGDWGDVLENYIQQNLSNILISLAKSFRKQLTLHQKIYDL